MALVSRPIANLFNGVSQQPAPLRSPSQCAAQENAYSSVATGTRKRAPTKHIAKLATATLTDSYVHFINRDEAERYVVRIVDGDLFVYDLAGNSKTVSFPDGKTYLDVAGAPRDSFAVMTVADFTFITNKEVVAAMGAATVAGTITGTKQKFSDLPAAAATGNIWEISGDPSNNFDTYYVKDNTGSVWVEWAKPGITYQFNSTTMPHKLVRNGDGTFTFSKITWNDRLVGDDNSNPIPSFIGKTIRDVFFYRNRLGLIADEGFGLSRPADYFNFWSQTITAVLDTDPVDAGVSHTKVSLLNFAVPYSKALMLFSDQTQFQVSGADTLTQKTVKADVVTEFESSSKVRPAGAGQDLFFVTEHGNYSAVREYFVEEETISNDAADITAHVPNYVPKNVFRLAVSSALDTLLLLSLEERNATYVYKYYWGDDQKLQSSWSKFMFQSADVILGCEFIQQKCYFVVKRSDGTYLEVMDFEANVKDTGLTFQVLLDRRVELTGAYSAPDGWTTWTLPYEDASTSDIEVVTSASFGSNKAAKLSVSRPSNTTVRATGDYSAFPCFVGVRYTMTYRFSEIQLRDEDRDVAVQNGRLQLTRFTINYSDSGYFRMQVTPKSRETYIYRFTGKVLGDQTLVIGSPNLLSGSFTFPIQARNLETVIELINDSHLPSQVHNAEWEGEFVIQSQRG